MARKFYPSIFNHGLFHVTVSLKLSTYNCFRTCASQLPKAVSSTCQLTIPRSIPEVGRSSINPRKWHKSESSRQCPEKDIKMWSWFAVKDHTQKTKFEKYPRINAKTSTSYKVELVATVLLCETVLMLYKNWMFSILIVQNGPVLLRKHVCDSVIN